MYLATAKDFPPREQYVKFKRHVRLLQNDKTPIENIIKILTINMNTPHTSHIPNNETNRRYKTKVLA